MRIIVPAAVVIETGEGCFFPFGFDLLRLMRVVTRMKPIPGTVGGDTETTARARLDPR
jgi:hypothetical protein